MQTKSGLIKFEWDEGNLDKSYIKHGISPKESEEIFVDGDSVVLPDVAHNQKENRYIIIGKTLEGKSLFVVFTFRGKKVRIISARKMHKREIDRYEKIKKNSKI